jgi:anaerobic dimethyl sulfoxide reductase subunit B (iron-sulfur subunit)
MPYAFYIDVSRCSGCEACVVACSDQNDLAAAEARDAWRRVFHLESGEGRAFESVHVSLGCMHCEDAPCLMACPTGALRRDAATKAVLTDEALCIGCHSCLVACPFGVPRFGPSGKMQKCTMCAERVEAGFEPACVRVCPTRALRFGPASTVREAAEMGAAARFARTRRVLGEGPTA